MRGSSSPGRTKTLLVRASSSVGDLLTFIWEAGKWTEAGSSGSFGSSGLSGNGVQGVQGSQENRNPGPRGLGVESRLSLSFCRLRTFRVSAQGRVKNG